MHFILYPNKLLGISVDPGFLSLGHLWLRLSADVAFLRALHRALSHQDDFLADLCDGDFFSPW